MFYKNINSRLCKHTKDKACAKILRLFKNIKDMQKYV